MDGLDLICAFSCGPETWRPIMDQQPLRHAETAKRHRGESAAQTFRLFFLRSLCVKVIIYS